MGPVAREDRTGRSVFSAGAATLEEVVVFKFDLSVPPVALEEVVVRSERSVASVGREDVKVFRSGLSAVAAAREEIVVFRSALSADWSEGLIDILFGFADIPTSSLFDSFSVVSALLSTDGRLFWVTDAVLDRGVTLVGFLALDVTVGLVGGLLRVDGVVLLVEVAVGLLAFVEVVVGLFSVDGFVVGVVVGLEEVVRGLFAVFEILERPGFVVESVPNALCGLEDERSMPCSNLLLINHLLDSLCYTKSHRTGVSQQIESKD